MKCTTVLISGKMGSGKTTVSVSLRDHLEACGHTVLTLKFADVIYEIHDMALAKIQEYGINPGTRKHRGLLQYLGTEFGRSIDSNIWAKVAVNRANRLFNNMKLAGHLSAVVIIDDCRYPEELHAFYGESLTVRLEAPELERRNRAESWSDTPHTSETALDFHGALFDRVFSTSVQGGMLPGDIATEIVKSLEFKTI